MTNCGSIIQRKIIPHPPHPNQRLKPTVSVILAILNYVLFFYQESLKPAQSSFVGESPGKYIKCYPLPLRTTFFSLLIIVFFLECLLLNLHSFSGTFQLNILSGRWCLQQFNNSILCRLQNSPYIPVVEYAHFTSVGKNFGLILFSSKRDVNNNANLGGVSCTSQLLVVLPMVKIFERILLFPRIV